MSVSKKISYKCDHCGFESTNKYDFRRFVGNVLVGLDGGIIGNNIDNGKGQRSDQHPIYDTRPLKIYASDLCLDCIIKILGITIDEEGNILDALVT